MLSKGIEFVFYLYCVEYFPIDTDGKTLDSQKVVLVPNYIKIKNN